MRHKDLRTFLFFMFDIRGLKTNFEIFYNLLSNTGFSFNIICLTKTCCSNYEIINSSSFDINNYKTRLLKEKQIKGEDLF